MDVRFLADYNNTASHGQHAEDGRHALVRQYKGRPVGKTSLEVTAKVEGVFAQQAFAQRVANKCAHGQGVSVLFWRIVERRTCGGHPKTAKTDGG